MNLFRSIIIILAIIAVFATASFTLAADPFNTPAEIEVIIRDNSGNLIKNANFEVYHQVRDADGKLALGKKVAGGHTGNLGKKTIRVNVKSFVEAGLGNRFVYKIFTKESKADPVFFYDNVITNNTHPTEVFKLNSIKISLFDANGVALNDKRFVVYKEDVEDGECDCTRKKIISTSTEDFGCKELYLSGGNYSIEVRTDGKLVYKKKFNVLSGRSEFDYYLSMLDVSFRDSFGEIIVNKKFEVYHQESNVKNELILGRRIGSYSTEDFGRKSILLPQGVYAIKFSGNTRQPYYINNIELIESVNKVIDYKLGGIKVSYSNISGDKKYDVLKGNLYYEEQGGSGILKTGKKITGVKVYYDESEIFELRKGSYVLVVGKEKFHNLETCDNKENVFFIKRTGSGYSYNFENNCIVTPPSVSVPSGVDPTLFIYGKERLKSLAEEQRKAVVLKQELEKIMGKGQIGVEARNWHILVNSYIYGEYDPAEIADTIKRGPQAVHPTIVAPSWRKSNDYKKYLNRIGR